MNDYQLFGSALIDAKKGRKNPLINKDTANLMMKNHLPNNKHIWIALTSIYGIGDTRAKYICDKVGIEATKKVKDLQEKDLESIRQFIDDYQLEGDLRRENSMNIKENCKRICWRSS